MSGGKCAITKCCCFDLHAGTRLCMIYTIVSSYLFIKIKDKDTYWTLTSV